MASPDISRYVDLTIYDLQPEQIYDAAVQYAQTALPEWTPISGSVEDALLQAAALMSGEVIGAINRLPAGVTEGLLRLYGIERNSGTAPSVTVDIELVDDAGHVIPVGTRFGYLDSDAADPILYVFESTQQVTVAVGDTTATVPVVGILLEDYPFLLEGAELQLLSAVSFIDTVTLSQTIDPGQDPETDTEFLNRAATTFGQLSEAIVLPAQFARHALVNYANIRRANAYSRLRTDMEITAWTANTGADTLTIDIGSDDGLVQGEPIRILVGDDGVDGVYLLSSVSAASATVAYEGEPVGASAGSSGIAIAHRLQDGTAQNGYVTVYVAGIDGASATAATLLTVEEDLRERAVAGLQIYASSAMEASLTVTVDVKKERSVTISAVSDAIEAALAQYVHPDYWSWDDVIYKNELISLVDRVPGVLRVIDVEMVAADPTLIDVDGGTGDATFLYKGLLPRQSTLVNASNE